jgi:RimJ/RimL family protein N-acetyltransferase
MAHAELSDQDCFFRLLGTYIPPQWLPPLIDEGVLHWSSACPEANPGPAGWTMWTLLLRSDNDTLAVANGRFKGMPDSTGTVGLGYTIREEHQGQGYVAEAVRVSTSGLSSPEMHVVGTESGPSGPSSARVPETCGFSLVVGSSKGGLVSYQRRKEPLRCERLQ